MTDKKKPGEIRARLEQADIDRRQQREGSMRSRGIYLSDNERADLQAIDDKYSPLLDAALQEEQAASATRPDVNTFYQGISPERNPGEWKAAQKRAADAIRAWEASAPQEWKDAQARLYVLFNNHSKETNAVYQAALNRQYKELGNDPAEITRRAKEQINRLITDQYNRYKAFSETCISMSAYDIVALGGKDWKLDAAETRNRILKALKPLHFKALGDNAGAIDEIKAYIDKAIHESPCIAPEGTPGTLGVVVLRERPAAGGPDEMIPGLAMLELTPDFIYGGFAVMPTSKVIQKQRDIVNGKRNLIDMGGEGEEHAYIVAGITSDKKIPAEAVEIQNVLGELFQTNGNKALILTYSQVWRAFACLDDGAGVSDKNQEYAKEMIDLLADAKGRIDFTQQIEKHKGIKKDDNYDYSKTILEGPLVMRDEITVIAGGHETKGIKLYRQPLYYMHSQLTGQITRIDRAVLDTTSKRIVDAQGNKRTVETRNNDRDWILLKRHLARQVEMMKAGKTANKGMYEGRRSFDSIIKALGYDQDRQPTPKQRRGLREDIDLLCARWKIQGYIKDYSLYKASGSKAFTGVKVEI